jgi:hypothetical protein
MRTLALLGVAVLLSACSFNEWREYDIKAASGRDVERVRHIMYDIAAEAEIPRHFGGFYSPNQPIAIFIRDKVEFSAFPERGEIRIWLMRSDWPPPPAFTRARRLIESTFPSAFGFRFVVEPPQPVHVVYTD